MTTTDYEPETDLGAASSPQGFEFGQQDGEPVLEPVRASEFPDRAMEPVQGLVWLGYLTEDIPLFGHRFILKTLTRGDKLIVAALTKEWEETLGMADAYSTATVAASLLSVDNEPLADLDRSADRQEAVNRTFARVKDWYGPVLDALFERASALEQRQVAAFLALQSK